MSFPRSYLRRDVAATLAELLAAGHDVRHALMLLAPRTGRSGRQLSTLEARLSRGDILDEKMPLPAELKAVLELDLPPAEAKAAFDALARQLRHGYRALLSPLLALVYPLAIGFLTAVFAAASTRWVRSPLVSALGSPAALAGWLILLALIGFWLLWRRAPGAPAGLLVGLVERLVGWLPGVRALLQQSALSLATRSLATSTKAGVGLPRALELAAMSCKNARYANGLRAAAIGCAAGAEPATELDDARLAVLADAFRHADAEDLPRVLALISETALERAECGVVRLRRLAFTLTLLIVAGFVGTLVVTSMAGFFDLAAGIGG